MSNQPRHIAIIMDGNGRWAEAQGKSRTYGHEKGAEIVRSITTYCGEHSEIDRLTLYAFSTENWKRPKLEVEFLMKLLE
ncbi:MAG: undecaprenyl diphosphate synthase family protein, partial [Sulfuricurvum sp.]|uniref:undecaprenyl diphosphate synthase family protein n=1 Tax=Sulfuricurvum sp. TaxID=2025608 RepID=UPI0025E34C06